VEGYLESSFAPGKGIQYILKQEAKISDYLANALFIFARSRAMADSITRWIQNQKLPVEAAMRGAILGYSRLRAETPGA
jgi:hypothetical protein